MSSKSYSDPDRATGDLREYLRQQYGDGERFRARCEFCRWQAEATTQELQQTVQALLVHHDEAHPEIDAPVAALFLWLDWP